MREAGRVAHLERATGVVSVVASGPAALLEEMENWSADPNAFNQAVKAATTIFEAMRPEGEFEPAAEIDLSAATGPRKEPLDIEDFSIPPLAWGHSVALGVLQAIVDPGAVGPTLKRLGSIISEKLGPEIIDRIAARAIARPRKAVQLPPPSHSKPSNQRKTDG